MSCVTLLETVLAPVFGTLNALCTLYDTSTRPRGTIAHIRVVAYAVRWGCSISDIPVRLLQFGRVHTASLQAVACTTEQVLERTIAKLVASLN